MGAYRSRPTASLQEVWREDCLRCYHRVFNLLDADCSIDLDESVDGWTTLHSAAFNCENTVRAHVDIERHAKSGTHHDKITPLHICAFQRSNPEATKSLALQLLDSHADPNVVTRNGFSPLHLAAAKWNIDMIQLLMDNKYRYKCPDQRTKVKTAQGVWYEVEPTNEPCFGLTPVHIATLRACSEEDEALDTLRLLLGLPDSDINTPDVNGFTPLHLAALGGLFNISQILIEAGADVTARTNGEETALHIAVAMGRFQIAKLLLQNKNVDINAVDQEGSTAAHYSCHRGDLQILEHLMISAGFNSLDIGNMYRNTPIHAACYQGRVEVMQFLLDPSRKGQELIVPDHLLKQNMFSETALHAAATNGQSPLLVRTLLQQGKVFVNVQGDDGHTPLHSACWNGNLEATRLLLEHGGDIRIKTYAERQTCVNWCHQKGYDEMLFMLHQHAEQLAQDYVQFDDDNNDDTVDETRTDKAEAWQDLLAEITGLPKPSPLGKIRHVTRQLADVQQLRNLLPASQQVASHKYQTMGEIGTGSFARVHKATLGNRIVAAKKYKEGHFHRKSNIDLYCREVSIHSKLNHEHILQFIGAVVSESPSGFCILTEYIDGGTLFDTLHVRKRSIEFKMRLSIAFGVASGMAYLHSLQVPIIHRDLNSHNVLLSSQMKAFVADFGESRYYSDGKFQAESPIPKNLTLQPGNLRWMAPEIFRQNSIYSLKADVYSYGLVVWELVTGQVPFAEFEPAAAAAQMAYHHQRPMIPDSCPKGVTALIAACWRVTHRSRPSFVEAKSWIQYRMPVCISKDLPRLPASTIRNIEQIFRLQDGDCIEPPQKQTHSTNGYVTSVQVAVPVRFSEATNA